MGFEIFTYILRWVTKLIDHLLYDQSLTGTISTCETWKTSAGSIISVFSLSFSGNHDNPSAFPCSDVLLYSMLYSNTARNRHIFANKQLSLLGLLSLGWIILFCECDWSLCPILHHMGQNCAYSHRRGITGKFQRKLCVIMYKNHIWSIPSLWKMHYYTLLSTPISVLVLIRVLVASSASTTACTFYVVLCKPSRSTSCPQ